MEEKTRGKKAGTLIYPYLIAVGFRANSLTTKLSMYEAVRLLLFS